MLKRAQTKLVPLTQRCNCELHQLFCIIKGRKPQRKCERGSHHGDKVKSLIDSNNVVHGGCTRAEDFCEAAVCFTVVSLILQSNPEQMSQTCPPALGTCHFEGVAQRKKQLILPLCIINCILFAWLALSPNCQGFNMLLRLILHDIPNPHTFATFQHGFCLHVHEGNVACLCSKEDKFMACS